MAPTPLSCLMNYDDHVLHATTIILVSGDLSWSCRKNMVPKTKSRANENGLTENKKSRQKKVGLKKQFFRREDSCQRKSDVLKKKLDDKN